MRQSERVMVGLAVNVPLDPRESPPDVQQTLSFRLRTSTPSHPCLAPATSPRSIIRSQRRRAAEVIQAWRGRVLGSVTKRMKMLAALLAWERGRYSLRRPG